MRRGDVVLVRVPHASGIRGKKRPAVVIQADAYHGKVPTIVIASFTKNLSMATDPACVLVEAASPEGKTAGIVRDSVISCLSLETVYADMVDHVLGTLPSALIEKLDRSLKSALGLA